MGRHQYLMRRRGGRTVISGVYLTQALFPKGRPSLLLAAVVYPQRGRRLAAGDNFRIDISTTAATLRKGILALRIYHLQS